MNDIYNRKDEEFSVIGEVPESFKFNDPLYKEGFQAGAASRDAEVARLKTVPMRYRRMALNAQLQDEVARLEQENDQLRAHINMLRDAFQTFIDGLGCERR